MSLIINRLLICALTYLNNFINNIIARENKINIPDDGKIFAQPISNRIKLDKLLDTTSNSQAVGGAGLSLAKAQLTFENFGTRNVPDDGDRFWVVGHKQWTDLLDLTQFASLDYVPANELPYSGGMTAKRWLGFMFYAFSGLPVDGSSGDYDWEGDIPLDQMPRLLNPDRGYIISCNNKIVNDSYPYFLGNSFMNGFRANRINQIFSSSSKISFKTRLNE